MELITPGREGRWTSEMFGTRNPGDVPYEFVATTEEAISVIQNLGAYEVAMDTETVYIPGVVDPLTAQLRVISIATSDENGQDIAFVLDVKDMDCQAIGEAFKERAAELGRKRMLLHGFNANFDDPVTTLNLTHKTATDDLPYRPLFDWVDLMFAVSLPRLGAPGQSWPSLAKASKQYLGYEMGGKGSTQLSYDAETPLTEEQKQYAAEDAVVTLWLADALREPLQEARLIEAFSLETQSRPFLNAMTLNGLPYDKEQWLENLGTIGEKAKSLLAEVAEVTGGQADLFGGMTPSFNPDSPSGLRKALNEHCPDLVNEYLKQRTQEDPVKSRPNTFQEYDSVDKTTLRLMQVYGERIGMDVSLVQTLIGYSSVSKVKSTYGESMMALLENGRFHSEFTQCLIATGRTSSSKPNAQNFSPLMKKFFVPTPRVDENGNEHRRVLIQGDYSQAELRVSAQLTGEPVRRDAFAEGRDQHAAVAAQMFEVDMEELLKTEDGKHRYKSFRSKAKPLNFGLGYGMREGLLADTLTQQGVITTKEEGAKLLADFFKALPKEAAWLEKRDEFVHRLAREVKVGLEKGTPIDFELTFRLWRLLEITRVQSNRLKREGLPRTIENIAVKHLETLSSNQDSAALKTSLMENLEWASKYTAAVILRGDGTPYEFFSTTIAKRRRVFQVAVKDLVEALAQTLASPRSPQGAVEVDRWAANHNMVFATNPHRFNANTGEVEISRRRKGLSFTELRKQFEAPKNKGLREEFVFQMLEEAKKRPPVKVSEASQPMSAYEALLRGAAAQQVGRKANAYRNAPIQGSVADAVLRAFADLFVLFDEYPTAKPVLTVHDSIVVECDIEQSREISDRMKEVMEAALAVYVPDVRVVADLEVLGSLDAEAHTIPVEELEAAEAAAIAA